MQNNIVNVREAIKICLEFTNSKKEYTKEKVIVRCTDNESYYFFGKVPMFFEKPKKKSKVNIILYTPDGIYKAETVFIDVDYSLEGILYELKPPKTWKFLQFRIGSRKKVKLPLKISFSDGYEIETVTEDLSIGGFSFIGKYDFSTSQAKFENVCKICFPEDSVVNFPDKVLEAKVVFVRKKAIEDDYERQGESLYCFKFVKLPQLVSRNIKQYLITLI